MRVTTAKTSGTFRLGDKEVRRMGFGAMRITGQGVWGPPKDHDEAIRVLKRAVELDVNLIDTADSYGPEVSENLIAEALHPYPEDLVIATKGGLCRTGPGEWPRDLRPERIKACCEASLKRLKVDQIYLYQLHAVDPNVPYEETVGAAKELQDEGKVKHVGVCNVGRTQLEVARGMVVGEGAEGVRGRGPRVPPMVPAGSGRPGRGRRLDVGLSRVGA